MSYNNGLSGFNKTITLSSDKTVKPKSDNIKIGRVYAIILDSNTPSSDIFNQFGGWGALGTVFYLDYYKRENFSNEEIIQKIKNNYFQTALPAEFSNKFYPLIGELIQIQDLPSPLTPFDKNTTLKYYSRVVNFWNNSHQNSDSVLDSNTLGQNFVQRSDVRALQPFEGDNIIEGRNGSSIRLSSSSPFNNNWWNNGLQSGDPITILGNGYKFDSTKSDPHLENLDNDGAFVILSSTQTIPLNFSKTLLNPLTKPISLENYRGSQSVLLGDRVVLGSKSDDLLLTSNQNIEIFTKNIINLDADNRITLNSPYILLGLNNDQIGTQPALLGTNTFNIILELFNSLSEFASKLSAAVSTTEGSPIIDITTAAASLSTDISNLTSNLTSILSQKIFISN